MTQPVAAFETMVREYKGKKRVAEFTRDSATLAAQGWSIASQVEIQPRTGCMRWLFLGLLALIFHPHPVLVVTYQRARSIPPVTG